jgi:Domain of unknown function (DUF5664)
MEEKFVKNDSGKWRFSLVPLDALQETIKVLEFGARKYTPDNWARGAEWSRYYNAAQRHLQAFWLREDNDQETGITHLGHALCCLLFLCAYQLRGIGIDDRQNIKGAK